MSVSAYTEEKTDTLLFSSLYIRQRGMTCQGVWHIRNGGIQACRWVRGITCQLVCHVGD